MAIIAGATRPLTIREIQAKKEKQRAAEKDKVTIQNLSAFQTITIQVKGKQDDSAIYQSCITLGPKKHVSIPRSRLLMTQITNLRSTGLIAVTGGQRK